MQKRRLLQSGSMVSEIGLGCLSFGGFYGPSTQTEANNTLATAWELGIDLLDMANVYGDGLSETLVGGFLKNTGAKFKIATKAGIWQDPATGKRSFNNGANYLRRELERSLRRLGMDHVDLFYVHRRDPSIDIEQVMETLLRFKAEGKISGIGFSEIAPASLRLAMAVGPVDAVQSEYSLWTRQPDLGMVGTCAQLGVAFVAYSPLGRGVFAAQPPNPAKFAPQDFRLQNPRFMEPNYSFNLEHLQAFAALAADLGVSPAALALAWCLVRAPNVIPIPGTRSALHLKECAKASEIPITNDVLREIERILPRGWAHGDRYSAAQWNGPEEYC